MSLALLEARPVPRVARTDFEFAPKVLSAARRDDVEANAAVVAAVAAVAALPLAVVIYICAVCAARSFAKCLHAVQVFWTGGC